MGVQVGDNKTFLGTITKNGGGTWSPPVATASFTFVRPDGTQFVKAGTVVNSITAVVSYTTVITDINQAGFWSLFVQVVDTANNELTMETPHTFGVGGIQ